MARVLLAVIAVPATAGVGERSAGADSERDRRQRSRQAVGANHEDLSFEWFWRRCPLTGGFELPAADFDFAPAKRLAAVAVTERVFAMLAERTRFVVGPSATLFATTGAVRGCVPYPAA